MRRRPRQAQALWGGGTANHVDEEALWLSGIWKPQDNAHFTTHEDEAPLPHIGGYRPGRDGLRNLLEHQRRGELDASQLYTQTIFVRQGDLLNGSTLLGFRQELRSLADETKSGQIRWVGLNEVLRIWEAQYGCRPNLFPYRQASRRTRVTVSDQMKSRAASSERARDMS